MIKKILFTLAALVTALSCAQKESPKMLVLYYSQTASTKAVADEIAQRLGADMEEIVPVEPYDGTYQETIQRCLAEMESGIVPDVNPLSSDIQKYDVIFLGYPIWFGTYARPVMGLLEKVDFAGKKIVPFCTFGSGGLDSSTRDLKAKQAEAEILPGYGVRTARVAAIPQEVDHFLKENGFLQGEYEKYPAFSEMRPATEEEAAIFDAAVAGYPMIHAQAKNVSSRAISAGMEYLFEAENIPANPEEAPANPGTIKVFVLDVEGQDPVFTQVLR